MQKESKLFFSFPNASIFAACRKDTKSREQNKRIYSFFCRDGVSSPLQTAELRKVESKTKEFILFFAETEYLRDLSQCYEKSL